MSIRFKDPKFSAFKLKKAYVKITFKTEKVFQKMGETNISILSLNYVFDLKKKVLFTNAFNKPFE